MTPVRAYYLSADSTVDESRPVSAEQLHNLGWELSTVGVTPDEIAQASQKVAEESGFPVTQEGCIIPFHYSLEKNPPTLAPEMLDLLKKLMRIDTSDICLKNEALVAITSGSRYLDVEDIAASDWIRIEVVTGMLVRIPTGAKYRLAFDEKNVEAGGIAYFKEFVSDHGLLVMEEIDAHEVRQAHLDKVLGQT